MGGQEMLKPKPEFNFSPSSANTSIDRVENLLAKGETSLLVIAKKNDEIHEYRIWGEPQLVEGNLRFDVAEKTVTDGTLVGDTVQEPLVWKDLQYFDSVSVYSAAESLFYGNIKPGMKFSVVPKPRKGGDIKFEAVSKKSPVNFTVKNTGNAGNGRLLFLNDGQENSRYTDTEFAQRFPEPRYRVEIPVPEALVDMAAKVAAEKVEQVIMSELMLLVEGLKNINLVLALLTNQKVTLTDTVKGETVEGMGLRLVGTSPLKIEISGGEEVETITGLESVLEYFKKLEVNAGFVDSALAEMLMKSLISSKVAIKAQ